MHVSLNTTVYNYRVTKYVFHFLYISEYSYTKYKLTGPSCRFVDFVDFSGQAGHAIIFSSFSELFSEFSVRKLLFVNCTILKFKKNLTSSFFRTKTCRYIKIGSFNLTFFGYNVPFSMEKLVWKIK